MTMPLPPRGRRMTYDGAGECLEALASAERPMPRRVVCAAVRVGDHVVCGPRHFDYVMREAIDFIRENGGPSFVAADQGFVDQRGEWLTREEAWKVAADAGQIVRPIPGCEGVLYSENLY